MTTTQRTFLALLALAAGSAWAGPDFFVIEQARKAQASADAAASAQQGADNRKAVLPLDHGPRAQSTPYLNAKRKA
jgi:hypothetical protein